MLKTINNLMIKKLLTIIVLFSFFIVSSYSVLNDANNYYTFDNAEISGSSLIDIGADGYDGTIGANVNTGQTGLILQSFNFDDTSTSLVTTSSNVILDTSAGWTLNFWVKYQPTSDSAEGIFGGSGNKISTDYANERSFIQSASGSGFINLDSSAFSTSNFNMFTYVGNSTDNKVYVYINGVLSNASSFTTTTFTLNEIGADSSSAGRNLDGDLDEMAIYKARELTQSEITSLYNSGSGLNPYSSIVGVINTNLTNGRSYPLQNISVSLNTTNVNTNMSYSINENAFTTLCLNCNYTINYINFSFGQNNVSFKSLNGAGVTYTNLTIYIDPFNPSLNVTNNSIFNTYTINFSEIISCSDPYLDYCNITIDNGDEISYTNQSYTFTYNGNHTFNVSAYDTAGNFNISNNNLLLLDPYFYVYVNNNSENLNSFSVNGTTYNNYFNGTIYDYGLGNHSFLFSNTSFEDQTFYLDFTNTSDINTTLYVDPVYINILIKSIDDGTDAPAGNYTILINNLDQEVSDIYSIVNNNSLNILNNYALNTSLSISLVDNDSITNTLTIINPRQNINVSLYITSLSEELRTITLKDSALNTIPNSYVYLYTYVPALNTFILQSQKLSNSLGQVSFKIVELTKIYNICNTYEGAEACLSQVTFEDVLTDPYELIHSSTSTGNTRTYLSYISWSYDEVKTNSSSQMTFTFNDAQSLVSQFCLNVSRYTNGTGAYINTYCNNNPSGQVVQTFSLGNDQYLEYTFDYTYEGNKTILATLKSYSINQDFNDLNESNILDIVFLILVFGGVGVLLSLRNFDFYNMGLMGLLLIVFVVQAYLNKEYVYIGIWGVLLIKTLTLYAVKVESS